MLQNPHFYNRTIRKIVIAFGTMFNDIEIIRYMKDGTPKERFKVPLSFGPKEKYLTRILSDPNLTKSVATTLPRISFNLDAMTYDSSRKQISTLKNFSNSNDVFKGQYVPVPYDFTFTMSIFVRNIEDGTQIIEHILPFFAPDYTLKLNLIPEMGIVKEIPVHLKNTNYEVTYEGASSNETRIIIWTLNFTVKGFVYGPVSEPKIIKSSITNIFDDTLSSANEVEFNMVSGGLGNYQEGEFVYQGFSLDNATATAKVISWNNTTLKLVVDNLSGNFVSNKPIYGVKTGSIYSFGYHTVLPQHLVKVQVTPNPPTANANSNYTYTTTISEFPNI